LIPCAVVLPQLLSHSHHYCRILPFPYKAIQRHKSVSVVCVFMSVQGTRSVRVVPDSCICRLRPFTLNQGTVPHSVPWYGIVCCGGWLVVIWHCNVPWQYPSLFAAVCCVCNAWFIVVVDDLKFQSFVLPEEVTTSLSGN